MFGLEHLFFFVFFFRTWRAKRKIYIYEVVRCAVRGASRAWKPTSAPVNSHRSGLEAAAVALRVVTFLGESRSNENRRRVSAAFFTGCFSPLQTAPPVRPRPEGPGSPRRCTVFGAGRGVGLGGRRGSGGVSQEYFNPLTSTNY